MSERIGVFVCWCGANIASTVEIEKVTEAISRIPDVVLATDYMYMCSDPGQQLIRDKIAEEQLEGIVVSSCSPRMHEATFRKAGESAGLNPYLVEIANIREQCSWVHQDDKQMATAKAISIIKAALEKVRRNRALVPIEVELTKRTLIVGGGITGIMAALELGDAGYETVLVEKGPRLGGKLNRLNKTYPYLMDAGVYLDQKRRQVENHENITVYTNSEVDTIDGFVGNFTAHIAERETDTIEEKIGAVIMATGYRLYETSNFPEYGGGELTDVIDALTFEEMLKSDGPTGGRVIRPSTGKEARSVLWVKCAGSRDPEFHKPYCSRVCCLYTVKQAKQYKQKYPEGTAFISYMDIRTDTKEGEEFYQQAMEEERLVYVRGRVSKVYKRGDTVVASIMDTLTKTALQIETELVVLAAALVPTEGIEELAKKMRATIDGNGFFTETHIKLYPVESSTKGVYLAGCAQAPKDITDSVSQALAATGKILSLFAGDTLKQDPLTARVDPDVCSGCGICVEACPYGAREINPTTLISDVNRALCEGCGACIAVCPNKACELINQTSIQNLEMINTLQETGAQE
jgi:heterodisulfide reductase subunit A2